MAVTTGGLPLGLAAIKLWTRSKFKGTAALKRRVNLMRVPIEQKESMCWLDNVRQASALFGQPEQCVHVGDRVIDIYELFCEACNAGHILFSVPARTGSLAMARKRWRHICDRFAVAACTESRYATARAIAAVRCWN